MVRPLYGDMTSITFGDGYDNPPHGVLGGTPGIGGGQWVQGPDGGPRTFGSACARLETPRGGMWVGVSTGGGGYGDPLWREVDAVRRDVRDGLIGRETAREVFGVVLGEAADPAVDLAATESLRQERRQWSRPPLLPTSPGAATWRREQMREGDVYLLNSA